MRTRSSILGGSTGGCPSHVSTTEQMLQVGMESALDLLLTSLGRRQGVGCTDTGEGSSQGDPARGRISHIHHQEIVRV